MFKEKYSNETELINLINEIAHNEEAEHAVEDIKKWIREYRSQRMIKSENGLFNYYGGANPND